MRTRAAFLTLLTAAVTLAVSATAAATTKEYVLKHPKNEHCKAQYVKKSKTVHRKVHGHAVTVRETVCVLSTPGKPPTSPSSKSAKPEECTPLVSGTGPVGETHLYAYQVILGCEKGEFGSFQVRRTGRSPPGVSPRKLVPRSHTRARSRRAPRSRALVSVLRSRRTKELHCALSSNPRSLPAKAPRPSQPRLRPRARPSTRRSGKPKAPAERRRSGGQQARLAAYTPPYSAASSPANGRAPGMISEFIPWTATG